MMKDTLTLRAHHGMCFQYFKGKGYSSDFTLNMGNIKELMEKENPVISIVNEGDIVCVKCPNLQNGICNSCEKVNRYDKGVLSACNITPGDSMRYYEFVDKVKKQILECGKREEICGDCMWTDLCR